MTGFGNPFYTIAATLLVAACVGAMATRLRQPLIVAFIAVGVIVGPAGLGWIEAEGPMELLATIGISILLFLVGLKLDLHIVRTMGPVALATGLGQVAFTSIFGFLICMALGFGVTPSIYIAVALTFSSTIIIVKLLSDKREIDSLHGRIAIGFLIVQDLAVIIAMIAISAAGAAGTNGEAERGLLLDVGLIVLKGLAMLVVVGLLMRFVIPRVLHVIARSQELLILFATAWAVALAAIGDSLGFSKEVGAFLAGFSLASTPYRDSIGGRLVSLRDFLLLFFFLNLGAALDLSRVGAQIGPAVILSLFVLIGNPIIVMIIMGLMGYRKRTGFLAGLTVAQISEFSLILAALGVSVGHIDDDALGLVTLVGLITIGLSTYMILYSHPLYHRIAPLLSVFERKIPHRELGEDDNSDDQYDAIIFGLGRYGDNIGRGLRERDMRILGVDFDPQAISSWRRQDLPAQYGDAEDPEFPASLPLERTRWIISAMPERDINITLMRNVREQGFNCSIAVTAHNQRDADTLRRLGADLVLMPFVDAASRAVEVITEQSGSTPSSEAQTNEEGASDEPSA
ncbi:MAG: sodium:proton exchanger [Phycisphaeraceae bacterium]|nr:MAG: sodium:proton exchanger [Phycisphaeraceae bacterium]